MDPTYCFINEAEGLQNTKSGCRDKNVLSIVCLGKCACSQKKTKKIIWVAPGCPFGLFHIRLQLSAEKLNRGCREPALKKYNRN